jgi:hypothetical protein
MIEFGGISYYIDLETFSKSITSNDKKDDKIKTKKIKQVFDSTGALLRVEEVEIISDREREIDVAKLDVVRTMIDVLMDDIDELDTTLGTERALEKTSLNYQIAFNTLYNYKILKEKQ